MGADQNNNNYHVKAEHSLLVFGGDHASCSSSDAEYGVGVGIGIGVEEKRRMSFVECSSSVDNGWNNEKQLDDGMWNMETTTPLMDYGLEEIKQLISSSSSPN